VINTARIQFSTTAYIHNNTEVICLHILYSFVRRRGYLLHVV